MELLEGEIPEAMYDNQANEMVREFDMRLRSQGLDMKTYMHFSKRPPQSFMETSLCM